MKKITTEQVHNAAAQFAMIGEVVSLEPYGEGHINTTDRVVTRTADGTEYEYILQAINSDVFPCPPEVMENIRAVTDFLNKKAGTRREVLQVVQTKDGKDYYKDDADIYFRTYEFVQDAICLQRPESTEDFYQSAYAFGKFQRDLSDFAADQLHESIVDFHNTPKRFGDFVAAVEADAVGRVATAADEIAFVKAREDFCHVLQDAHAAGKLPLRVTHNDTKINNVMLDAATRTALCVIDLDTVMPGFSVTDFGDAIRFGANTAAEDERDLSKVSLDMELFETYLRGYLDGCGGKLGADEIRLLPEGAKMMTLECGMRFLADYLQGDTYFKTAYPEHNLVRCHTQFRLVECMEEHWDEMKACAEKFIKA